MVGKKREDFFSQCSRNISGGGGWLVWREKCGDLSNASWPQKNSFSRLDKTRNFLVSHVWFFFRGITKSVRSGCQGFGARFVPNPCTYTCVLSTNGATRINIMYKFFFLTPYAAAGNWAHVSRVAPTRDLLKDALPTELPRRGRFWGQNSKLTVSLCFEFWPTWPRTSWKN